MPKQKWKSSKNWLQTTELLGLLPCPGSRTLPLLEIIQQARRLRFNLIITTDHGTINVDQPIEVKGNRELSMNLRYKTGQSLSYPSKSVMEINNPKELQLPATHLNSKFIFAKEQQYFVYQNNFNHYANHFRNTFQHGGISMEEMIIPLL